MTYYEKFAMFIPKEYKKEYAELIGILQTDMIRKGSGIEEEMERAGKRADEIISKIDKELLRKIDKKMLRKLEDAGYYKE